MKKENVLVFGASQHCRYTLDIIEQEDKFRIVGILDDKLPIGQDYGGYQILGTINDLREVIKTHSVSKGIIAIGDNFIRFKISEKIKNLSDQFAFISAVHPSVIIGKNVKIGEGTLIMAGVIVNNDTIIGEHCFLATNTSIDHDCILDNYASVSAGAAIGGSVRIGYCTAVALGANVIHGMNIGKHSVVGAGSLVVKNIGDNLVVYGVPAKEIRKRVAGDKYL